MLEFDGKGKYAGDIPPYVAPEKWEEVTVKQFFDLAEWEKAGGSLQKKLEILTGVSSDTWSKAPVKVVEGHISTCFTWTIYPFDWDAYKAPKYLEIDGKKLKAPKDFRELQFGAYMAGEAAVDLALVKIPAEDEDSEERTELDPDKFQSVMPELVAIALCKEYAGDYTEEKAEELKEKLMSLPACKVLSLGFFYLKVLVMLVHNGRRHLAIRSKEMNMQPG